LRLRRLGWALCGSTPLLAGLALLGCLSGVARGGIHARMGYSEEGGLRVLEAPAEGPAAHAGLRAGDRIITLEGEPVRGLSLDEIVERLRGPIGSEIEIEVVRDGEPITLRVRRAPYDSRRHRPTREGP